VGIEPEMGGEDFGRFGRTKEQVPICLFRLGAVAPEAVAAAAAGGPALPSLHSSRFAPVLEPTLSTGSMAMAAAVLDLLGAR
jgi:hippurate hydrolase